MKFDDRLCIRDQKVRRQTVLVRIDADVSISRGKVLDDSRLRSSLPTLQQLITGGARVVIIGHRGRPKGRRVFSLSLRLVARALSRLLKRRVSFVEQSVGPIVLSALKKIKNDELLMLENLRFEIGEEQNDPKFAKQLSSIADVYVNESFGNAHREHASVVGIPKFLPSTVGLHFYEEIQMLSKLLARPKKPFVAVIGGAKISSKAAVIKKLCQVADAVLVGGALANTLLFAQHHPVGRSLIEKNLASTGKELLYHRLRIPIDVMTSTSLQRGTRSQKKAVGAVQPRDIILDIGPDTVELYSNVLQTANTIMWAGPMGYVEDARFTQGTFQIAREIARHHGTRIAGGGDTLDVIRRLKLKNKFSFVSMGGGAMLQFVEGRPLPAIQAIKLSHHL